MEEDLAKFLPIWKFLFCSFFSDSGTVHSAFERELGLGFLKKGCFSASVVVMGDEKSAIAMASRDRERDRELLIPVAESVIDEASSKPSSSSSSSHHSGREV